MKVVVSAVSFSKNEFLTSTLFDHFPDAIVNYEGKRFTQQELVQYYKNADAIITGLERIDDALLAELPNLKMVAKFGVGLDNIDIESCKRRNIEIGWTGGINKNSVAEMTLGFMLMLSRNLYITSNQLKEGIWNKNGGYSLSELTIGIIGLGYIGKELVRLLNPFNVNILGNDILEVSSYASESNIKIVSKEELYKLSDIITIHTPFTELTKNLINIDSIAQMKESVLLVNTARGGIINELDLKNSLLSGRIAGAAIDVYQIEPPKDLELLTIPNLICTPHIAGNANKAVIAMGMEPINHILIFKKKYKK
jgi:phosphoglycerate dehydrogenase-like enzyme